jgi:hypothetical protein
VFAVYDRIRTVYDRIPRLTENCAILIPSKVPRTEKHRSRKGVDIMKKRVEATKAFRVIAVVAIVINCVNLIISLVERDVESSRNTMINMLCMLCCIAMFSSSLKSEKSDKQEDAVIEIRKESRK